MTELLAPFGYEFFRNGLVAATLAGGLCGLVGTFVVLRGMSYAGHGLAHAIFGGAVVSYMASINFYAGAGAWGFLAALLVAAVARRRGVGADAAIGVVTTASFALGVVLISRSSTFTRNFEAALFGDVNGVADGDIAVLALTAAATAVAIFLRYRSLVFTAFDPDVAEVFGVRTAWVDALFSLILAATVVGSMRVLGVTLIAAALVVPPVTARMLTDSFGRMLLGATVLGAACGLVGMHVAWHADASSGATVVLVAATAFTAVFVATGARARRRLPSRAAEAGADLRAP